MAIETDTQLFPLWPDDCGPDRFAPRHVNFPAAEPDPDNPGEVKTSAVYTNLRDQEFRLTGSAAERDAKALDEFCAALRIWMEAVPATGDLKRALREAEKPPKFDDAPGEDEATITLEFHANDESLRPTVVFALVDPDIDTINKKQRHNYKRPSNGQATLTVKKGRARLAGVVGSPHDISAGHSSPSRAAGRFCSVFGLGTATYYLPTVWRQY